MRRGRGIKVLVLAAVAGLTISACGDDGDEASAPTTPPQPAKVMVEATASEDGKTFKLDVPQTLAPGVTEFTLTNSTREPTELQFVVLTQGHMLSEFLPLIEEDGSPVPSWVTTGGGVGSTNPGESRTAVINLKPGRYDFFSTAAPDESVDEQHKRGAKGSFQVTGENSSAVMPTPAATMSIREYTFEPKGLKAGDNQVLVSNIGGQLHHWAMVKVKDGAKWDDVVKFIQTENPKGEPPINFSSFSNTAVLDSKTSQVDDVKLEAGRYAFLCFINDRQGGPPHALRPGDPMIKEVTITA